MAHIKIGDLVIIIEPPICPRAKRNANVGEIFVVRAIKAGFKDCGYCGGETHIPWAPAAHDGRRKWVPLYRLRRIPPLPELDGEHEPMTIDIFNADDGEREIRRRARASHDSAMAGRLLRTIKKPDRVLAAEIMPGVSAGPMMTGGAPHG